MRKNHCGGLVVQGFDDDLAGTAAGAVDGAAEDIWGGYEAMALVDVD
jgi:hypothetical protein